jgi:F420-dependent oxidoreductase-like protein
MPPLRGCPYRRQMRFGLFVPQGWRLDLVGIPVERQWQPMLDVARLAEHGPFESVWVYDHFHTVPAPTQEATHEAWTLMAALAASTSRIRLGQMCSCMGYRNPVYLAKIAATVDAISGGRTEMGIGAGWYEHEWRAYGYGFPTARERLAMLDEGVQIMRQAWAEGIVTLHGSHYQVDGAIVQPRPVQPGGIPLWIAGGGEKKTLRIAAQHAQYTNFDGRVKAFAHKSQVLADHCKDLGRDFDEIVRSANYNVVIGQTEADVADRIARAKDRWQSLVPPDAAEGFARMLYGGPMVGTPEQLVERLGELQSIGMTYAILNFADVAYDPSGVQLFVDQVIPALSS